MNLKMNKDTAAETAIIHGLFNEARPEAQRIAHTVQGQGEQLASLITRVNELSRDMPAILGQLERTNQTNFQLRERIEKLEDQLRKNDSYFCEIEQIRGKVQAARRGRRGECIYESEFFTDPRGYRAQIQLFLHNQHIGVRFKILDGLHDPSLSLPFQKSVVICMLDQAPQCQKHAVKTLNEAPNGVLPNEPITCDEFINVSEVMNENSVFVKDNNLILQVITV